MITVLSQLTEKIIAEGEQRAFKQMDSVGYRLGGVGGLFPHHGLDVDGSPGAAGQNVVAAEVDDYDRTDVS
jgi:hypothetical protein